MSVAFDNLHDADGTLITAHTADGGLGLWSMLVQTGPGVPTIAGNKLPLYRDDLGQVLLATGKLTDPTGAQSAIIETDGGAQYIQFGLAGGFSGGWVTDAVGATLQDDGQGGSVELAFPGIGNQFHCVGDSTVAQRYGVQLDADGTLHFFSEPSGGGARSYWPIEKLVGAVWVPQGTGIATGAAIVARFGFVDYVAISMTGDLLFASIEPATFGPVSSITADPDTVEAGPSRSLITVTALDGEGDPVVGATVVLSATGTGNTITQPTAPTDASGVAVGYLSSTKAEVKTVSATVNGVDLGVTVDVTVTAGPPDPTESYLDPSSLDTTAGAAGTAITIWVRDQFGNPVPGATVAVTVTGGSATPPDPTGSDGSTTTTYTPPTSSGPQLLTALGIDFPITVHAGPFTSFAVLAPATVVLGGVTTVSIEAQDVFGNLVTTFTGQVDVTGVDGAELLMRVSAGGPWSPDPAVPWDATVPGPVRTPAFIAGVGSADVTFIACGAASHLAAQEVGGAHTGLSDPISAGEPWAVGPPAGGTWGS